MTPQLDNEEFENVVPFKRPGHPKSAYKAMAKSAGETLNIWSPIKRKYFGMIDDPKKFPRFLHPLISKDRVFTLGRDVPSYQNFPIDIQDSYGVHRKLYLSICRENFILGAVGALMLGYATKHYTSAGFLRTMFDKKFIAVAPVFTQGAISTVATGVGACWKITSRACIGGLGYDLVKRGRDQSHINEGWLNAAISGGFWGFAFGIGGGWPIAWAGSCVGSTVALLSELATKRIFEVQSVLDQVPDTPLFLPVEVEVDDSDSD